MSYEYHVDLHLVIDATGSMGPVIDGAKALAGSMHTAIVAGLKAQQKQVDKLRVSVTAFRDFACDGKSALVCSGFLNLPEQEGELRDFIARITPSGGGDTPENSLEALAFALNSDWTDQGGRQRHVAVMFTDAPPHPYGSVTGPGRPSNLPDTMDDVRALWRGEKQGSRLRPSARRLYIIVPPGIPDYECWRDEDLVALMPIERALSSADAARDHIVSTLVNSV